LCIEKELDRLDRESATRDRKPMVFIDMHAEATAEKRALAEFVDGRAAVVVGTHTHVQTADEQISAKGTAFITDAGMTGCHDSIIGLKTEVALKRFLYQTPHKYEEALGSTAHPGCGGQGGGGQQPGPVDPPPVPPGIQPGLSMSTPPDPRTLIQNALCFNPSGRQPSAWPPCWSKVDTDRRYAAAWRMPCPPPIAPWCPPGAISCCPPSTMHTPISGWAGEFLDALDAGPLRTAGGLCHAIAGHAARCRRRGDRNTARGLAAGFRVAPGHGPCRAAAGLDAATGDVPLFLETHDLHSVLVNRAVLELAGITARTPDPAGGAIERDCRRRAHGPAARECRRACPGAETGSLR
jgi:hypothetical protein